MDRVEAGGGGPGGLFPTGDGGEAGDGFPAGDGGEGRGQLESAPLATGSMGRSVSQSTTQPKSQALWPSRARVGHSETEGNLGCGPPPPLRGIASPLEETGSREPPPWGRGTQPCPWEPHCGDGGEESVSVWRRSQPGGEGRKKNQTRSQDWYFCVCVSVCVCIFLGPNLRRIWKFPSESEL